MNGCWKDDGRRFVELKDDGSEKEAPEAIAGLETAERGVANVEINEGTESICLPCRTTVWLDWVLKGKTLEAMNEDVRRARPLAWTGTPPDEDGMFANLGKTTASTIEDGREIPEGNHRGK